jgi:hypothetical protein
LRFALGGQQKLAGLTGAAYKFTTAKFFTRATGTEPKRSRLASAARRTRHVRARRERRSCVGLTRFDAAVAVAPVRPQLAPRLESLGHIAMCVTMAYMLVLVR